MYFRIIIFSLFIGCATKISQSVFNDSNQYFLEQVIAKLNISEEMDGKISKKYRLGVYSIDTNENVARPIITMIEDHFIVSLVDNGFTLFERDTGLISKLSKEGEVKYSLSSLNSTVEMSEETIPSESKQNNLDIYETHLNSVEIAIFYRLLEAGIIYQDHPDEKGYNKRTGMVRIHIRILNTQTGEILHTAYITGKLSDSVRKEYKSQPAAFHYTFSH